MCIRDSFEFGRHTRAMIRASAMSRSRPAGPNNPGRPSALAWAWTAATCPWGRERATVAAAAAGTNAWPAREARIISVSYTHLRAHETVLDLVCRLLLEKKKNPQSHPRPDLVRNRL